MHFGKIDVNQWKLHGYYWYTRLIYFSYVYMTPMTRERDTCPDASPIVYAYRTPLQMTLAVEPPNLSQSRDSAAKTWTTTHEGHQAHGTCMNLQPSQGTTTCVLQHAFPRWLPAVAPKVRVCSSFRLHFNLNSANQAVKHRLLQIKYNDTETYNILSIPKCKPL